jgi:hypothetical protein
MSSGIKTLRPMGAKARGGEEVRGGKRWEGGKVGRWEGGKVGRWEGTKLGDWRLEMGLRVEESKGRQSSVEGLACPAVATDPLHQENKCLPQRECFSLAFLRASAGDLYIVPPSHLPTFALSTANLQSPISNLQSPISNLPSTPHPSRANRAQRGANSGIGDALLP